MEHITIPMQNALVRLTVGCMLNPNNEHFYIETLTLEKVAKIIDGDTEFADTFWTAYHIANEINQKRYIRALAYECADTIHSIF